MRANPDSEFKLSEKVKTPSSNFFIEGLRNFTNLIFTNMDIKFTGAENLENINSPIIFAVAPHNGHIDSLLARRGIGYASTKSRKKSIFIAAGDGYWNKQPRKSLGNMAVRTFSVSRKGGAETKRDKHQVEQIIRQGNHLVLFPEGTRSRNTYEKVKQRDFKTGAAQWAIATRDLDTVIVPIHLSGTEQIMPPGSSWPKRKASRNSKKFSVNLTIGTPIKVADQIPHNFEELPEKQQYQIIKQVTAQIKGFMEAQEEFKLRGSKAVKPY